MGSKEQGFWSVTTIAIQKARSAVVVMSGLFALVVIAGIALVIVASKDRSGEQIVMLATSAFGVIGAVIGAYFGVNASANARDAMKEVALGQLSSGGAAADPGAEDLAQGEVDEAAVYGETSPIEVSTEDAMRAIEEEPLDDELLEDAAVALATAGDDIALGLDPDDAADLSTTYIVPGDGTNGRTDG